ncbi:hypothetical protein F511_11837 [Dorcoceras hygrometricum]|uniref:Uncharacterized protein n=1 Tax=Dorcoceras hygrometricum TaxID=472368 RepID=A0A2Z7BGN1_9LAMI|nr:hypothetical protein F511_11837 [Dorcoceras hygrometricum]
MGRPGQARTKPRRKLAVATMPEHRRTAAAANVARGTRPRAASHRRAMYGAWPRVQHPIMAQQIAPWPAGHRPASMQQFAWPVRGAVADQSRNSWASTLTAALKDVILLHLHDIENKFTTRFDAQDRWFGNDSNDQRNLLSLEIKSSQRQINTQIAAATLDQIDMQREVKELNAKVDAMATNLEILRRNAEATKEAISHQLLEFQAKIAADILSLSIQIGELVDHIRGGDAKKGEIGSSTRRPPPVRVERRPLPTQANLGESSSGHGRVPSVEEATEMVREADRQADRWEREREREKRLRRLRKRGH